MTKEEFENLKFGDKIYNSVGDCCLWVCNTTLHNSTLLYRVYFDCSGILEYDEVCIMKVFSLTKPKKKVKKTVSGYMHHSDLHHAAYTALIDEELLNFRGNDDNYIPVTITYETEEEPCEH